MYILAHVLNEGKISDNSDFFTYINADYIESMTPRKILIKEHDTYVYYAYIDIHCGPSYRITCTSYEKAVELIGDILDAKTANRNLLVIPPETKFKMWERLPYHV